jgi:hypothetical protein
MAQDILSNELPIQSANFGFCGKNYTYEEMVRGIPLAPDLHHVERHGGRINYCHQYSPSVSNFQR